MTLPSSSAPEGAARSAMAGLRRAAARLGRRLAFLRRVPVELRLGLLVLALFVGGFFLVVVPLLTSGGHDAHAEISGRYPATIPLGQDYPLLVALDNTSTAVIAPVCVIARTRPGGVLTAVDATFQGLETVPFVSGRACGGSLSGQETINVRVTLRPLRAGTVQVSLVAGEGAREIGPALSGSVSVAAG